MASPQSAKPQRRRPVEKDANDNPSPATRHNRLAWGAAALLAVGALAIGVGTCQLHSRGVDARPASSGPASSAYLPDTDVEGPMVTDIPKRRFRIIDVHEHLQTERDAQLLVNAMDEFGVGMACLQGSSIFTLTLNNRYGFEQFEENNAQLLALKKAFPGRFCAFVTLNPPDEGNLERLQRYVARGADGLKLYLGHGASHGKGPFHMMPLNDVRMRPIYAYAQAIQLPITLHVNLINYWDEMLAVLEEFPYLRVNIPHFGLHKNTSRRLDRLAWLLTRYPNVYTDVSFGWQEFHRQGFESLASHLDRSREFFLAHRDKILFASDLVIEKGKTQQHVDEVLRSYMQLLETTSFRFFLVPDRVMRGLALSDDILKAIYEQAPARYLHLDDTGALRDRAAGWPPEGQPVPGLPPTVAVVEPLDPNTVPP